jgi:conjugative relaxase-like TrwC/TraI family protein
MLSIGKMLTGSEEYYLGVVASGREEYYVGGGEAPGVWLGQGSASLGLSGQVGPGPLRVLLAGFSPTDGQRLTSRPVGAARVTGFDLTFSAPKSVSVLWGLSDPDISKAVRRSHDGAIVEALGYLERHATMARRGASGLRRIGAGGLVAASFRHRTSRSGDPQLHTHVLVANAVCGEDGRWSAPDARLLYFHARTGGFVYQAALRARLVESLGVSFGPVTNGSAEVLGVPDDVTRLFATRRADIEAALESRGAHSARAAQLATLATRPAKPRRGLETSLGTESLTDSWRRRALGLGVGPDELRQALGPARSVELDAALSEEMSAGLLGTEGLTAKTSTFERRDLVRGIAERLADGSPAAVIDALADRVLTSPAVVALEATGPGGGPLHTTTELLSIEGRLVSAAESRRATATAMVTPAVIEATLATRPSLSDEQRSLIGRLVSSGDGVEVVVGKAGSGKTMALEAARAAWEEGCFSVTGTALAARAAAELADRSGMSSVTVAALVARMDRGETVFGSRQVLVIDEAAMVGTRTLAKLVDAAGAAGTKIVLLGDHRQIPEIEAGGAFASLARRLSAGELVHNRRQHAAWERTALDELRSGNVGVALDSYQARGRIHQNRQIGQARTAMVSDWMAARESGADVRMLAARRVDIDELNRLARSELRGAGRLADDIAVTARRGFAVDDEVMCLRNDPRLGVRNGTRGQVVSSGEGALVIATDDGERHIDQDYLEAGWLDYGYATTVHKSQGETVERAFVLGAGGVYREAAYVAMSRARTRSDLYVVDDDFAISKERTVDEDPLADLKQLLSTSRAKSLASDVTAQGQAVAAGPTSGAKDRKVDEARTTALLVRDYRRRFAVSEATGLGTRPVDPEQRSAFDLALEAALAWERQRGRARELQAPGRGRGR